MRARIGIALGTCWSGIVYAVDVIALISALGAIGVLPVLLKALTRYARFAMSWLRVCSRIPRLHLSTRHGMNEPCANREP
jgi:hypothetical protein